MKGPGSCPVTVVATKSGHDPSSDTVTITLFPQESFLP